MTIEVDWMDAKDIEAEASGLLAHVRLNIQKN